MEVDIRTIVGEIPQTDGDGPGRLRQDTMQGLVVSQLQARYSELMSRKRIFYAANQAAQAVSVALATTYTGLCLSNPIPSAVVLVPIQVGIALSVAPAAIAPIGLIGGRSPSTEVAHTTPLVVGCGYLGSAGATVGKADSAATIPTPTWLDMLMGGFTAAALPATGPTLIDLAGAWGIPPGSFMAIGALTAVTGLFSIKWIEMPLKAYPVG